VLTQVAGQPVCPSDDVDQAWHLHITRTADYERFCREALGRFVHHRPAEAGASEHERHRTMYAQTLTHYRRAFQATPSADVWPGTAERFARPRFSPTLIELPGPFGHGPFLAVAVGALVIVLAMALNLLGVLDATHAISGPRFLLVALPLTLAVLVLAWLSTGPLARSRPRDTLDAYEAAWLAGGDARLTVTAMAMLVERGALVLQRVQTGTGWRRRTINRLSFEGARPDGLHPVEAACLAGVRGAVLEFDGANSALAGSRRQIITRLQRAGLAADGGRMEPSRAVMAGVTAAWLAVALERILHAIGTLRPMAFLVLLTLVGVATLLGLILRRRATWRGRKALAELVQDLERRRLRPGKPTREPISPMTLPFALALLGPTAVLAQPAFMGLDEAIGPRGMRQAGAGSSSGDGGGGCGSGGCGGGGCGGGCGG
jgi:uncharacterized protein (TIGR04222 family)